MGENVTVDTKQDIRRNHIMTLMRFFSVESDVSLPNANQEAQMLEMVSLADLRSKQFVLKVVQLLTGFICVGIYTEGLTFLKDSIKSMLFPNIVFSSFIIITSVILLSCLLGCAMQDVLIRIFNILGMILYFSAATVVLYEALTKKVAEDLDKQLIYQRKLLFVTTAMSYFNSVVYAVDVYFSIKKAISFEANK